MPGRGGSDLDVFEALLLVREVRVRRRPGVVGDLLVVLVVQRHATRACARKVGRGSGRGQVRLLVVPADVGVDRLVDEVLDKGGAYQ